MSCADSLAAQGIDLAAYNTPNLLRDLKSIRHALRIPKVILFGVSYGAFLGLQALRDADDWVESAVLVSMPRPQGGTVVRSGQSAQAAIDTFTAQCAAQPACAAYGDFAANLDALLSQLIQQPLEIALPSPMGSANTFPLTADMLGTFLQFAFTDPMHGSTFPKAVARALHGETDLWTPYVQSLLGQPAISPDLIVSLPLHNSVWCSEELNIGSAAEMEQRAAGSDAIVRRDFLSALRSEYEVCEVWPVPDADPALYSPVITSIPTYLIAGALDPITRPEFSRQALRHLRRGQLTIVTSAGHLAAEHNACAPELVSRFMATPHARVADSCTAAAVAFVP